MRSLINTLIKVVMKRAPRGLADWQEPGTNPRARGVICYSYEREGRALSWGLKSIYIEMNWADVLRNGYHYFPQSNLLYNELAKMYKYS